VRPKISDAVLQYALGIGIEGGAVVSGDKNSSYHILNFYLGIGKL
jgi:hypothetical protein